MKHTPTLVLVALLAGVARAQDGDPVEGVQAATHTVLSKLAHLWNQLLELLPLLLVALLLLVAFWHLARWISQRDWPFSKVTDNPFLADILRQIARFAVAGAGLLLALDLLGWTALVGAALGTAGVVGIAVGFAFRDLVENYLSSILLSLRRPFEPDDHVKIGSDEGRVVRLTSRATILMTLDGNHLRIPNATVFKATILNYTRNPNRRFEFLVDVGTTDPLQRARDLGESVLRSIDGVLADPAVASSVVELGASTVPLKFLGWVDQRSHSLGKVRSEAIRRVKLAFEDAGISMPEPTNRLLLLDADGGALSVALVPESQGTATPARPAQEDDMRAAVDLSADDELAGEVRAARADGEGSDLLSGDAPSEL